MAPHQVVAAVAPVEEEQQKLNDINKIKHKSYDGIFGHYETDLIWLHIIPITILNLLGIYAFLTFPYSTHLMTFAWVVVMCGVAGFGVTAGAHRLWCHRSYKAKAPLQILLMICYSSAGQNTIFDWVRDHRVHHRFSESDADPHNSNRGFFFAHMGWLFMRKHPDVLRKGKEVDMSDITDDPLLKIHHKYFQILRVIFCFVIPVAIPVYFWNESFYYAAISQWFIRYNVVLHSTWSVNSAAHLFGYKPYDLNINPRENILVSIFAMGEGWHNYHHTFPWDYKASEYGTLNLTLVFLNLMARIGWAYDLKTPTPELVNMVRKKRGDDLHSHEEVPESLNSKKL